MLILLPPSEGKASPRRGKSLDLSTLSSPGLTEPRRLILESLVELCREDPDKAADVLGLGRSQRDLVARNAVLDEAPTARTGEIYTGVLYDALGLSTLPTAAKRRATGRIAIVSALFGLVGPADRIPAYRLSGDATLPGVGSVAGVWREHLGEAVRAGMGLGLLVDLRSSTYAAFWRPTNDITARVATVRVIHEADGRRAVVSHFNKATKGRIVRALLEDGVAPRTPTALAETLTRLGWTVEIGAPTSTGTRLDVVVRQV